MTLFASVASTLRTLGLALPAALPGLLFGYNLIQIVDSKKFQDYYVFATTQSDIILGTFLLGVLFGIFIAGYVNHSSGRKLPLIASTILCALSVLAAILAPSFTVFLFAQLAIGFAGGIYIVTSHLYLCEVALPHTRVLSLMQIPIFISLGAVLSLTVLSQHYEAFNLTALVAFGLIVFDILLAIYMLIIVPESPRYLAYSGAPDAALHILNRLRKNIYVAARELAEINQSCRDDVRDLDFFMMHVMSRRILTFLCVIAFLYNLSGANIIPYLVLAVLSRDLNCAGDECTIEFSMTILILTVVLLMLATLTHAWALENHSRRKVIVISSLIGGCALVVLFTVWLFPESLMQDVLIHIAIAVYLFFFMGANISFLSVLAVELLPSHSREIGLTAVFIANTIGILFGLQMYQPGIHLFGYSGFFAANAAVSFILIFILWRFLPSSYSGSLEELERKIISVDSFQELKQMRPNAVE